MNEHDRALAVTLRAAQWLLDDVANSLRRGQATLAMWQELRDALDDLAVLVRDRARSADGDETNDQQ